MKRAMRFAPVVAGLMLAWVAALTVAAPDRVLAATARSAARSAQQTNSSKSKSTRRRKLRHASKRERGQKAPTRDRISEIQSALARGGYYKGDPNGKWDSNAVTAMRNFQSANGLDATGKLDALSLQKLGLGSDIAGVSAPKPAVPSGASAASTSNPSRPAVTAQGSQPAAPGGSSPLGAAAAGGQIADPKPTQ